MLRALGRADPVRRFEAWMREHAGLADDELAALERASRKRSAEAVTRAEASAWPDPDTLEDGVYAG